MELPQQPEDSERLAKLRAEAQQRMYEEERLAPVSVRPGRRKWTVRGLVLLVLAFLAGIVAWVLARQPRPGPVVLYGGPPPHIDQPNQDRPNPRPPAPVYGGPPPRPIEPPRQK